MFYHFERYYDVCQICDVEADSLEEALEKIKNGEFSADEYGEIGWRDNLELGGDIVGMCYGEGDTPEEAWDNIGEDIPKDKWVYD